MILRMDSNHFRKDYREYFDRVDRAHDSALDGDGCAACREAHANFADVLSNCFLSYRQECVLCEVGQGILILFTLTSCFKG
jgi:hypothetical protein